MKNVASSEPEEGQLSRTCMSQVTARLTICEPLTVSIASFRNNPSRNSSSHNLENSASFAPPSSIQRSNSLGRRFMRANVHIPLILQSQSYSSDFFDGKHQVVVSFSQTADNLAAKLLVRRLAWSVIRNNSPTVRATHTPKFLSTQLPICVGWCSCRLRSLTHAVLMLLTEYSHNFFHLVRLGQLHFFRSK